MKITFDVTTGNVSVASELDAARRRGVQEFLEDAKATDPELFRALVAGASGLMDRIATAVMTSERGIEKIDTAMAELGFDELTGNHLLEAVLFMPSAQYRMNAKRRSRRKRR